jgi:protease-4
MVRRVLVLPAVAIVLAVGGCFMPDRELHEREIDGEGYGSAKIAIIDVVGAIDDAEPVGSGSRAKAAQVIERLRLAQRDHSVKAVVIAIDSPGGDAAASDAIHRQIKEVRAAGKPVVAHMGSVCASGGYFVSTACERIVASPLAITGSIGAVFQSADLSGLLQQKLGIGFTTITSGQFKDIASPLRPMRDDERRLLQELIDHTFDRFLAVVVDGRRGHGPIPADADAAMAAIRPLADGRVFSGDQAVALGLADEIGGLFDAVAAARQLAHAPHARVVRYEREDLDLGLLSLESRARVNVNSGVQIDASGLARLPSPRIAYLWSP